MKKLFVLIFLLPVFAAYADEGKVYVYDVDVFWSDSLLLVDANQQPVTGLVQAGDKSNGYYKISNVRDGKIESSYGYEDEIMVSEMFMFENGALVMRFFDKDGVLAKETISMDDAVISKSYKDGKLDKVEKLSVDGK